MTIASLPDGYTARPPTVADAQAIAELIAACQRADGDAADMTAEELLNDWTGIDLAEEAVAVLAPDERIAGYADLFNRRYVQVSVQGYVHPEHRELGIGAYLVRWGETWTQDRIRHAPEQARVVVEHFFREGTYLCQ